MRRLRSAPRPRPCENVLTGFCYMCRIRTEVGRRLREMEIRG
jgi:hypothetical protein